MGPLLPNKKLKKKKRKKAENLPEAAKQQTGDTQDPSAYRLGRDPLSPYPTPTTKIYPVSAQPVHALSTDHWCSVSFRLWQI